MQELAVCFVNDDYYNSSVTNIKKKLGWSNFWDRRKNLKFLVMFKIINSQFAVPCRIK